MRTLRRFFKRLTGSTTTHRDRTRLQAEIAEHLALQIDENLRAGLPPAEARRQALLKFGSLESLRESYRDERALPWLDSMSQDARHALRRLRNSPAFTITTILTLALGIGATTSIFTLVHAVLLSSLAVANPAELWRLGKESRCCYWGGYSQDKEFSIVSYPLYKHFRDNTKEFAELAAFSASTQLYGVRRAGKPDAAQSFPGEFVSGNYFRMFGINAYAGRALVPADDRLGAPPVAMMSYRLWHERYGADPSVIGGVFNLSNRPFTVVGITPPAFFGDTLRDDPPDFYIPLNQESPHGDDGDLNEPSTNWLLLIGRIRPGANPTAIESEMRVELTAWLRSHWGDMTANDRVKLPQQTLYLRPGGAGISSMREQYEHWLRILMVVAAFVLVIVCANVASLMLVRGMQRRQQTSLSMALGARPSRLVHLALTESLLLSLAGGAAGLAIAFTGTRLILDFAFPSTTSLAAVPISAAPSLAILLFAFAISLVTGIAFGIAPAWMATRIDPIEALRGASRSTIGTGSLARKTLVVLQAALSLVVLSASGLLSAAVYTLENQDFGFRSDRRMVVHFDPRLAGYAANQLTPLYQRVHDSYAALPGVAAVALCVYTPFGGNNWGAGVLVDGHRPPGPNDDDYSSWDRVTAGYFEVIANPILRGRGIQQQDTATSPHVAVINEAFARKFFPGENPLGRHFGQHGIGSEREYEIVGIAKDARYLDSQLDKPIGPFFFLPESQHDFDAKTPGQDQNSGSHYLRDIVILAQPGVRLSQTALRQTMAAVDPGLPIISIQSLNNQIAFNFRQQRLIARLTSFFGLLSLVLSCLGLYGITAWNAGQRTSEIGVRMALGANARDVITLVLRGAFTLILLGLVLGLPFSLRAGRVLGDLLYGTNPSNPAVIVGAVAALGLSALIASIIPALRASRISPIAALRSE